MKKSMFAILLITGSIWLLTAGIVYAATAEAPVAPEVSAPGDIPDSQAFIVFKSSVGFSIKARTALANGFCNMPSVFAITRRANLNVSS